MELPVHNLEENRCDKPLQWLSVVICVGSFSAAAETQAPALTLQAGLFSSQTAAKSLVKKIKDSGRSDVEIIHGIGGYRVIVGKFADLTELTTVRSELKEKGVASFPKNLDELFSAHDGTSTAALAYKPLAEIQNVEVSSELRRSDLGQKVAKLIVIPASDISRHQELADAIQSLPADNPLKAELICAYARKRQHATKSGKGVKTLLESVANGEVRGSSSHILEARRQLARIAHYYEGNSTLAYRAYKQLLGDAEKVNDRVLTAEMQVQIAAVCFERVRSKKPALVNNLSALFEEGVRSNNASLNSPELSIDAKKRIRAFNARLQLMDLEYSAAHTDDDGVVKKAQAFIDHYSEYAAQNGEVAEAFRVIAKAAWRKKDGSLCLAACNAAIDLTADKRSIWADKARDTRFDCLLTKFNVLRTFDLGSPEEIQNIRALAHSEFPDHPNLKYFTVPKLP